MAFTVKYRSLFTVDILHRYPLNKGLSEYQSMTPEEQSRQLDSYDFNTFFSLKPTRETQTLLNGQKLVCRNLNTGIAVWSKVNETNENEPFIPLANDLVFTFLITLKDTRFYNYTNLKPENAGRLYCFTNLKPDTEAGSFTLIANAGDNTVVDENFMLSDDGAKTERAKLSASEKKDLFGLLKIAVKGESPSNNLTTGSGEIKQAPKAFEMLFDNRKTLWRYLFAQDQTVVAADDVKLENGNAKQLVTKAAQPLTQKGFVSVELGGAELPNPDSRLIVPGTTNTYYSEIYM